MRARSVAALAGVLGLATFAPALLVSSSSATCVQPASTPGDGLDDRAAVQAAIDEAVAGPGCVDLGGGRWDISRRPEAGPIGIPSLSIRGPLVLRGPGTLAMLGSAVRPGELAPADWVLLEVRATDVVLQDVAFDGAARGASGEQTHLLQVRGPSERVVVERSTFSLPRVGGDCIRLLGEAGARVRDVTIRDVHAPVCWRSFLGIQRGVHGVLFERVRTDWVGDQVIDSEPTGGPNFACQPIASGITIRDSVLRRGVPHGIAISVAGDGCAVMDAVLIENVVLPDGGIDIIDVGTVTLRGLHVASAPAPDAQPTILARRRVGALTIQDSVITRAAHAKPQPVIQISSLSGVAPTWAWLDNVTVEQADPRAAVRTEGLGTLVIRRSRLRYTGAAGDWAISGSTGALVLDGTEVTGAWRGVSP